MHVCEKCLSHVIHYRYISTAVMVIIRVIYKITVCAWGMQWRSWLKNCATSRKVVGSIPDGVTGIFHRHNPSIHTVALGLTQPPTEMSTRNISLGLKAAGA
jgi:hypothetical protein